MSYLIRLTKLVAFFVFICMDSAALAQSRETDAFVDSLANRIVSVWENETKDTIALLHPDLNNSAKVIPLEIVSTKGASGDCNLSPRVEMRSSGPVAVLPKILIYYQLYLAQPSMLNYFGFGEYSDATAIIKYSYFLSEKLLLEERNCLSAQSGAMRPTLKIESFHFFSPNPDGYNRVLSDAMRRPMAMELADYVASAPFFQILLHETAHVVLGHLGKHGSEGYEFQADAFATEIMLENGIPPSLSAPAFLLMASYGGDTMYCRMLLTMNPVSRSANLAKPIARYSREIDRLTTQLRAIASETCPNLQ